MRNLPKFFPKIDLGGSKKAFWSSFAIIFTLVFLQQLGFRPPKNASAQSQNVAKQEKKVDILNSIKSKLERYKPDFQLKKPISWVQPTLAGADYDNAKAYSVVDLGTGTVLKEKSLSSALPIASITKVMTAITALDLVDEDELITVTQNAADQEPTKIELQPGDKLTLKELLQASLITSANDATEAIKDGINTKYGENVFIRAMNYKAKYLGLKNTMFANAKGFDSPHNYSSPEDLTILASYALKNYPLFAQIVGKEFATLEDNGLHTSHNLYNWNGLLGVYPGTYGVKIGNTDEAGTTTQVVSERNGKRLMTVVLGAPGILERDMWAAQLLDYGFSHLGVPAANITEQQFRDKYGTWRYGE